MDPMKPFMFVALSTAVALAQPPAGAVVRFSTGGQTIEGQTVQFISAMSIGPVIAGAPYSADVVNESVQTLADGNRIVEKTTTKQYRDSQGRERKELGSMITISDPIARAQYTLHPKTMMAETMPAREATRQFFFLAFENQYKRAVTETAHVGVRALDRAAQEQDGAGPTTTTPLGISNIEGVQATGTRRVSIIPAGAVGNERPIEVVDENWTSPELGITVLTTHSDPRSGVTTYKLTNIQRSEPPRSLFEIPSGYQIFESGTTTRKEE
jgi:hypothetical protein